MSDGSRSDLDALQLALSVFQYGPRSPLRLAHLQTITARMIDDGYTNAEIAERLGVSVRSVERYASVVGEARGGKRPRGRPRIKPSLLSSSGRCPG